MDFSYRITKEIDSIKNEIIKHRNGNEDLGFRLTEGEKEREFVICIKGPEGSPYEGGYFNLQQVQTANYPTEPPKVKFTSKILHPNVSSSGDICLNILKNIKNGWSPIMRIEKVIISILQLLNDPNPDDPYNSDLAKKFKSSKSEQERVVKECTKDHAQFQQCIIKDW